MKRIWFNHWFSTAYYFIKSLKEDKNNYVIATNQNPYCVYSLIADEFYLEKELPETDYVDWCLNFCGEHSIDVFFVRHNANAILRNLVRFDTAGVKVIIDSNFNMHRTLGSKFDSYELIRDTGACKTVATYRVTAPEDFKKAYDELKIRYGNNHPICVKADVDEGGITYRKLATYDDFAAYFRALKSTFRPLVLMPYLEGPEISIDCINLNGELVAVPRIKASSRTTQISFDPALLAIAERVNKVIDIRYPYNIQLRSLNGEFVFMEVNTRLSGGSYKDEAIGCSFPKLALAAAFNDAVDVKLLKSGFKDMTLYKLEGFVTKEES